MRDDFNREISYLRISVTDLCNFNCEYCMPEGIEKKDHSDILRIEEIENICKVAARNGIKKIRLTGGEPLVRKGILSLINKIKSIISNFFEIIFFIISSYLKVHFFYMKMLILLLTGYNLNYLTKK